MRGKAERLAVTLTAITPRAPVPQGHPIRHIKPMVDRALAGMPSTFDRRYAENGWTSIPPRIVPGKGTLPWSCCPGRQAAGESQWAPTGAATPRASLAGAGN